MKRFLIVDDNEQHLYLLETILKNSGYNVESASNGAEALEKTRANPPDMIISDILMPVMDGYEATRKIRKLPGGAEVKIVAVTASALEEDQGAILGAGCDGLVRKPFQDHEIFDAMARKEVYATTGPRILVRFFGGWDFSADDAKNRLPAEIGYSKGVPMGGDLTEANGKSPQFIVWAIKDPIGPGLDRIQIIKGWLDASGKLHEKIYDVAVSGDRKIGKDGKTFDI